MIAGGFVIYGLHSTVISQKNYQDRKDSAFALALSLPMILMSFLGGDNFNTNPINLQIWTSFVGVLVVRKQLQREKLFHRKVAIQSAAISSPPPQLAHPARKMRAGA